MQESLPLYFISAISRVLSLEGTVMYVERNNSKKLLMFIFHLLTATFYTYIVFKYIIHAFST